MIEGLGHRAASGAVWATIDRFASMGMQFFINLILARLLSPEDFGIIGMLAIFIAVSQTLIDGGFGSALIQKKRPTQIDYSTIFFWNIGFSILLYLILFFVSPLIAIFFGLPLLCIVLRVIAISLIISGILTIQRTRLQKELAFRTIAIVNLTSYIIGATCAVLMAHLGWGVWSLVWMQLIYGCTSVLILWIVTRWSPSLIFSRNSLKELFGFGGFIMAANLLQSICQNVQGLIIGKRFSAIQMGYFSQAYKLDQITSYSIPQVLVQVVYPIYSSLQEDKSRLHDMVLMNMRVVAFVVFPILGSLILIAEPLITFLYGEKWLPSVPYFRILCVGGFFVCLQNINFYAVAAVGKSKSLFKWSFYKWGFLLGALLIGMNFGMYGILWCLVLSSINIFLTNACLSSKYIHIQFSSQIGIILTVFAVTFISIGLGCCIIYQFHSNILGVMVAISSYICFSHLLRLKALHETLTIIRKILKL